MEFRKDKEYLDPLEKKLYDRDAEFTYRKQKLKKREYNTKNKWAKDDPGPVRAKPIQSQLLLKLFFASLVFFVLAAGFAVYRLFIEPRVVSPDNVEIVVKAPANVSGGEPTQIQILITNDNNVPMESTDLEIVHADGVSLVEPERDDDRFRKGIGVILPGQTVTEDLTYVAFGEENSEKIFNINLEYRIQGSNAIFSKEKEFSFILATAPVSLSLDIPEEINVGEEVKLVIETSSNATNILPDFMVLVEYPFGFEFVGSTPRPADSNNIWFFGDITPSTRKKIEIVGSIEGVLEEQKTFRVFAGTRDARNSRALDVVYNEQLKTVSVKESPIAVTLSLNGDTTSEEIVVTEGGQVSGQINWRNNIPAQILNGEITLLLSGLAIDKESVAANKGVYNSISNTITWNQTTDRELATLEPGESGTLRFSFETKAAQGGGQVTNPEIQLVLSVTGERVSSGFPNREVVVTVERDVKVATALQLASYGLYFTGPFTNTGPVPPKVDNETTYTIVWSVTNSSNRVRNVIVRASIPLYVSWLSQVSPSFENVTFNSLTGEIMWDIGELAPGVGVTSSSRDVHFQVGMVPAANQVGDTPTIISGAEITGVDVFTNSVLSHTTRSIDTFLVRDSGFSSSVMGQVVP